MPVKQYAELPLPVTVGSAPAADLPAFVVIETQAHRAFLSIHNAEGHLLSESAYTTPEEARAAAEADFPSLTTWNSFTETAPSIAAVIRERARQRYENFSKNTLLYAQPERPKRKSAILPGFPGEVVSNVMLAVAFCLIFYPPGILGLYLWHNVVYWERWEPLPVAADVGLICIVASTLMWRFRTSHFIFGLIGAALLALVIGQILVTAFGLLTSTHEFDSFTGVLVAVTCAPCVAVWVWRFRNLLDRLSGKP
jgi:hypothetical protein